MRLKPIAAAVAAAGLLATASAGAWSLSDLIHGRTTPAATTTTAAAAAPAPATPTATASIPVGGAAPNYRQIVQTFGPAVVGVTVAACLEPKMADTILPNTLMLSSRRYFLSLPGVGAQTFPLSCRPRSVRPSNSASPVLIMQQRRSATWLPPYSGRA